MGATARAGRDAQKCAQEANLSVSVQRLRIAGWLPAQVANGSHGHWSTRRGIYQRAKLGAYVAALDARWRPVRGRARLDIVLVFPQHRRRDTDNLYARCKGLVDGIKPFIVDDATEWLELHVSARVEPGRRAVEMTLSGRDG